MKTNFLKTSLSAFAFALAIVASFAFSPALNSTDEVVTEQGYTQSTDPLAPCDLSISTCESGGVSNCTVGIGNYSVYKLEYSQGATQCTEQLYKPEL